MPTLPRLTATQETALKLLGYSCEFNKFDPNLQVVRKDDLSLALQNLDGTWRIAYSQRVTPQQRIELNAILDIIEDNRGKI